MYRIFHVGMKHEKNHSGLDSKNASSNTDLAKLLLQNCRRRNSLCKVKECIFFFGSRAFDQGQTCPGGGGYREGMKATPPQTCRSLKHTGGQRPERSVPVKGQG